MTIPLDAAYRFTLLSPLSKLREDSLLAIPGVTTSGHGNDPTKRDRRPTPIIDAPLNAGWLVEQSLRSWGLAASMRPPALFQAPVPGLRRSEVYPWVYDRSGSFKATDYQLAIPAERRATGGGTVWAPPGAGKTAIFVLWSLSYPHDPENVLGHGACNTPIVCVTVKKGIRQCIDEGWRAFADVEPYRLRAPSSRRKKDGTLEEYLTRCAVRRGQNGLPRRPIVVVNWDVLDDLLDELLTAFRSAMKDPTICTILDECFPAGTMVATPTGPRAIETLHFGDVVWGRDSSGFSVQRRVTGTFSKTVDGPLTCVVHEQGQFFCTQNHEVWTDEDGYTPACLLRPGTHLRVLWEGAREKAATTLLRSKVLSALACDHRGGSSTSAYDGHTYNRTARVAVHAILEGSGVSSEDDGTHAGEQSDGRPGCAAPYHRGCSGTEASRRRWQWTAFDAATTPAFGPAARMETRARDRRRHSHSSAPWRGHTQLQSGLGRHPDENCGGVRRRLAPVTEGSGARRTERYHPGRPWLGSIALHERSDSGRPAWHGGRNQSSAASARVYDIEVEEVHNYFAENVLVHNCHAGKQAKRASFSTSVGIAGWNPETGQHVYEDVLTATEERSRSSAAYRLACASTYRLATTGSPVFNRVATDMWGQLTLAEPYAWGRTAYRFKQRYTVATGNDHGTTYAGLNAANVGELRARLAFSVSQVTYGEVRKQMKPVRDIVHWVELEDQDKALPFTAEERAEMKALEKAWAAGVDGAAQRLGEYRRMEAASKKRSALLEQIRMYMSERPAAPVREGEADEASALPKGKVLVFTGRQRDCDAIGERVQTWLDREMKAGRLPDHSAVWSMHGGDTSSDSREDIRRAYMAHPGPCCLVTTGQFMGDSVSLHDSDAQLFAMIPITPGENLQQRGRIERLGMTRGCARVYLLARATIEESFVRLLRPKIAEVGKLVDPTALLDLDNTLRGWKSDRVMYAELLTALRSGDHGVPAEDDADGTLVPEGAADG